MELRPQDVLVALKLVAQNGASASYSALANELSLSPSEAHEAVRRCLAAGLVVTDPRAGKQKGLSALLVNRAALLDFLEHGVRYVFVPDRGTMVRGMPTAHAAPPLAKQFVEDSEPPPVWPTEDGMTRGLAFSPLYSSAPSAAAKDPALYELLSLVDAIRGGRARERNMAIAELKKRLE